MEQAAVVGELRVEIITRTATGAQVVEVNALDILDVARLEDLVDTASMLVQSATFLLTAMEGTRAFC